MSRFPVTNNKKQEGPSKIGEMEAGQTVAIIRKNLSKAIDQDTKNCEKMKGLDHDVDITFWQAKEPTASLIPRSVAPNEAQSSGCL